MVKVSVIFKQWKYHQWIEHTITFTEINQEWQLGDFILKLKEIQEE